MTKLKVVRDDIAQGLELLNQDLQVEYSMIVHYPQFAEMIRDEKIRRQVIAMGIASTRHADVVSKAIIKLGGLPQWSFEFMERDVGFLNFFEKQLEKEKLALKLHQQAASLMQDDSLEREFDQLVEEEKMHIKTIKAIIAGFN